MEPFLETVYGMEMISGRDLPELSRRKTLVAVPDQPSVLLATGLFSKMFDKLGLKFEEEAAILPIEDLHIQFPALKRQVGFDRVILCGVHPGQIGLQSECPLHIPLHLGTVFLLRTEKPATLEAASRETKAAFWQAFQTAFKG